MITLNHITLRRGAKVLLDGASATIHAGEKVALVGRNGAGKSTLLALLEGQLHEDAGDWSMPPGWRIAQVAQDMPETEQAATDFVLAGDNRLTALQLQLSQAEQAGDGMAMAQAHSDLADAGAHDARSRAEALLLGIGFASDELTQPVNRFSGGWRMRLQLARALMAPSDLLLLDEPTNHLDLDAMVWLEGWLARYPGTLIVISHDREFLDALATVTLHIAQEQLTRYSGNYSAFEQQHAEQLRLQQASWTRQQQHIAHLQSFITRFRAKATKARQAQSRIKALERLERVAPVLSEAEFQFSFAEPDNLPNPMLAISDGVLGYADGDGPLPVLHAVNQTVMARQRIGILGANGQGKSTFIKTVAGVLPPLQGTMTAGKELNIGYFAQQELDVLRCDDTPLQHMQQLARQVGRQGSEDAREQKLRNFLGGFAFSGDMVQQRVGQFSGGEKARLALAMIVWQRPNLLLLDEPTNHLDLTTRQALALALTGFDGSLIVVSHDRALLRAVCDEYWLVAGGSIRPFDGDLADYQRYLAEQARLRNQRASPDPAPDDRAGLSQRTRAPAQARQAAARRRQQLTEQARPLRRKLKAAEQRMHTIEQARTVLQDKLLTPLPHEEIAEAGRELKRLEIELQDLEESWLDISAQIEALEHVLA
ncbi:MAG: ATP-binding cassette domain-containing protein [Ottowia sp.]|nr:ATP-binding cassette domain-containing protein [Ottowia sp.]